MVAWKKFKERVFSSGIEAGLRQTAWKFLLGFYLYDSTLAERKALLTAKRVEYARMKSQWRTLNDEQASRSALRPCCLQNITSVTSNACKEMVLLQLQMSASAAALNGKQVTVHRFPQPQRPFQHAHKAAKSMFAAAKQLAAYQP